MADKQKNIVVSGFGGQGVLFLGRIISQAAMIEGKNTTWIPSYGAEMRGGSANCYVIVSDECIASPIFDSIDYGVFLSKQALSKFMGMVKKDGFILADTSFTGNIEGKTGMEYCLEPFNDIIVAENKKLILNIVILGALIKKTGILMKESVLSAIKEISMIKNPKFLDTNIKSFEFGWSLI